MPLRGFFYFADLYKKLTKDIDLSVRKLIKIPTPHYLVFYNGTDIKEEEYIQKLSDAYESPDEGCIELTVRVININFGHNKELLSKCESLYGYAYFVAKIRRYLDSMSLEDAVRTAIDDCISENILKNFLLEQKAEVIAMSIYEYNEEYVRKSLYQDGIEDGYQSGDASRLIHSVDSVMQKLNLNIEESCGIVGTTMLEYQHAKELLASK